MIHLESVKEENTKYKYLTFNDFKTLSEGDTFQFLQTNLGYCINTTFTTTSEWVDLIFKESDLLLLKEERFQYGKYRQKL